MSLSRECTCCRKTKDIDQFYKSRNHKLGVYPACKNCVIAKYHVIATTAKHIAGRKRSRKRSGTKLRDAAFSAYGGYICKCCGETEKMFLTIDHINNDGAQHRKEVKIKLYTWLKHNNYPDGFQVLCYNCNCGKHRNNGICPHKN